MLFAKDGNVYWKIGGTRQILLRASDKAMVKDGAILHNHPDGGAPSPDDCNSVTQWDPAVCAIALRPQNRMLLIERPTIGWEAAGLKDAGRRAVVRSAMAIYDPTRNEDLQESYQRMNQYGLRLFLEELNKRSIRWHLEEQLELR